MYKINTGNLAQNKILICKEWNIQPSEIDRMPFYEYEMMREQISTIQKEQEKRQKEEEKKYSGMKQNMNPASMMNSMRNMPGMKMPSLPRVSMPRI